MTKPFAELRKRPALLGSLCAVAVALIAFSAIALGAQPDDILSRASVLRDPDIPALGNPKGDLTVVEYFDYQCPYCKKLAPELAKVIQEDGHVRLVLKDWPIFGDASVFAAKMALASKYQDKYAAAYQALIGAKTKLTAATTSDLLAQAGIDVARLQADLQAHQKSLDDLLARNGAQADAFGFEGTPSFIVGTFRVPGMVEMNVFKQVIADARAAVKKH